MNRFFFVLTLLGLSMPSLFAQDLTVPADILAELTTETFVDSALAGGSISFVVAYPKNFDPDRKYPVLLALSGGGQTEAIAQYCYAAWFRSTHFEAYITILPLSTAGSNLRNYDAAQIDALVQTIKQHFPVVENDWLLAGSSNGGVAAFNFLSALPTQFQGAIVMPGTAAESVVVTSNWKHLDLVLAYGDEDDQAWIDGSNSTAEKLKPYVARVQTVVLKGQGHILPIGFDIDQVYDRYVEK